MLSTVKAVTHQALRWAQALLQSVELWLPHQVTPGSHGSQCDTE